MRDIIVVTGSAGLIGSEAARLFHAHGHRIIGIDNDMRRHFFGADASTAWNRAKLEQELPAYRHVDADIRNAEAIGKLLAEFGSQVGLIVHAAAQPSHDWAASDPMMDFTVNANGTLVMLESMRRHCPEASFIFTSTNKVYGDRPNELPLIEQERRWELDPAHPYALHGIDENMSIDQTLHSLFGASKVAADMLVQEYGRYFGLKTAVFRGGCLTGPSHSGAKLHGFLAYLMKCAATGQPYTVLGYKGKQVRDNIHSHDLVKAFWHFYNQPRSGEVYNIGGGRHSNCSMIEAIELCEQISGRRLNWTYDETNRKGDHIWWISDTRRFEAHYPNWRLSYDVRGILEEIFAENRLRWSRAS
jgi:CDP-paratose 2-epimerase